MQVPAYADFIKERFERCLDLYLCPRTRRKRLFVPDAKALVPKLPKPRDLQPFPTMLALRYIGHEAAVRPLNSTLHLRDCLAVHSFTACVATRAWQPGAPTLPTVRQHPVVLTTTEDPATGGWCTLAVPLIEVVGDESTCLCRSGAWQLMHVGSGWRRALTTATCECGRCAAGAACAPGSWAPKCAASPGARACLFWPRLRATTSPCCLLVWTKAPLSITI